MFVRNTDAAVSPEHERLSAARDASVAWRSWGPYLSERQWGTVREDTSNDGDAWNAFSHDQARSRAYRWGEDGLAGFSDDNQRLCVAVALWNGRDPILKERLFGLTNGEGNHGEDVKEYYFYLDGTPTHSWMQYLYKYPQAAFPYDDLLSSNQHRSTDQPEYELIDTGVFADDRYFDVLVSYAKASPTDLLIEITISNRGKDQASLHVLPTAWFRNTWSWGPNETRPELHQAAPGLVCARHTTLGTYWLACQGAPALLFTNNETNCRRLWGEPNRTPFVKDGIDAFVVGGRLGAINPEQRGTKVAADYLLELDAGASRSVRLRLSAGDTQASAADFNSVLQDRKREADLFYASILPSTLDEDQQRVARQAYAGLFWTKQYYSLDVSRWLEAHGVDPFATGRGCGIRNAEWPHMVSNDVISMPDKWEYPWYAAWDLAFHAVAFAFVDLDFAKQQLQLLLRQHYMHPNGQLPAYEWSFGDVNPPVHAWAAYFIYSVEKSQTGQGDQQFLRYAFEKLLLNFTWWVNRKDPSGTNVFQGGFLGLDNIGVFDRSHPLPTGGFLEQADGTAWMVFYCQMMLAIALELAPDDALYEELAAKFLEQGLRIVAAMDRIGDQTEGLWDEQDGFFYDVLRLPDGRATRLKVRSLVGLLPLCATIVAPAATVQSLPNFVRHVHWIREHRPELAKHMAQITTPGVDGRYLFSALDEDKLRRVLARLLDEDEFLSPFGIRSLSRRHLLEPYMFRVGDKEFRVAYEPAESTTRMFGGNSNWRGPIWFPINTLVIRALERLSTYYGENFKIELPTGSGQRATLNEIARDLTDRLERIFLRDETGKRPVYGGTEKFQDDPYWRDLILFYEYFHGDNGAGIGASHQTGWTALVASLSCYFASEVTEVRAPALQSA
jgi:Glycosyl hydrolase family 63 C-terminal domain